MLNVPFPGPPSPHRNRDNTRQNGHLRKQKQVVTSTDKGRKHDTESLQTNKGIRSFGRPVARKNEQRRLLMVDRRTLDATPDAW
jgi:hypothetical protein